MFLNVCFVNILQHCSVVRGNAPPFGRHTMFIRRVRAQQLVIQLWDSLNLPKPHCHRPGCFYCNLLGVEDIHSRQENHLCMPEVVRPRYLQLLTMWSCVEMDGRSLLAHHHLKRCI